MDDSLGDSVESLSSSAGTGPNGSVVPSPGVSSDRKPKPITGRSGTMIYALARRLLGTEREAEAVTSEVLAAALRGSLTACPASPLTEMTVRAVLEIRDDQSCPAEESAAPKPPVLPTALADLVPLFEQALLRLPETYRDVFVLGDIEGVSISQIATLLGLKAMDAKLRLHRARILMQDCLRRPLPGRSGID